jgi:hypothetical protein
VEGERGRDKGGRMEGEEEGGSRTGGHDVPLRLKLSEVPNRENKGDTYGQSKKLTRFGRGSLDCPVLGAWALVSHFLDSKNHDMHVVIHFFVLVL